MMADESLDRRLRGVARLGLWVVGAWVLVFVLWAGWAPISGGVVAQGIVKVEANRRTVTHRDGGTVAKILVREGQAVRKGDVLVELEDVRVEASVDLLRAQLAADRLRQSRLEAESAAQASWKVPPGLQAEYHDVKRFPELMAKERATFAARQSNLSSQIEGERRQAQDTRTEIEVRLKERENTSKAVGLMREELVLNQRLEQEQYVNRARVMGLQRGVSEYESRQFANEAELAQAKQRLGALEAHVRALRDGLVQQANEELREVTARINDAEQRLRSSSDDRSRQTVLAPESGRLMNLRVNTPGSALGPREPIVDIVPADAPLQLEVRLPLDVAADVHAGTPAEVKLLTAGARYERLLEAQVVEVSADAMADEHNGAPFLRALLRVSPQADAAAASHAIRPGMAAEVYIKTTERTPLGFLLEPVGGYFRRAFREH
ncbi:MAG TPA: HlyD family type I secretion periplasmic adaptor subunit [Ideonella sp.]|jgi:HlyD family type I secretion membrane fusion protein|nr:HlyD family type I secretion periplasmic adaptor subunit [Ideonella sp.]